MRDIDSKPPHLSHSLTAAQLGIWLGQQVHSGPMYNAAEFIELRGTLNVDYFTQSLREIVAETITLNMIFEQTSTDLQQQLKAANWQLIERDFSSDSKPFEQAQKWMRDDLMCTVDLATGPLFRQALLTLGENHYLWYQCIHHIACDGFGFALLTQAVAERYNQYQNNNGAVEIKKNTDVQLTAYRRVLAEDAEYNNSAAAKKDREFWLQKFSNNHFPEKESPPIAIADSNIRVTSDIRTETFLQLQSLASQLESSWSDLLIASVAQLLYQHTAAPEIIIGLPVMNRMGSASLRVPAMVMNIIPVRIQLRDKKNFADLAQHINAQLKTCRPHQRYRYEQLKHDLALNNQQRLFGPVINVMPFDRPLDFVNIQAQVHNLSAGPVEDISFAFVLKKNGDLRIDIDGNPNRYTMDQLQHFQQDLLQILTQVQRNSQLPLKPDVNKLSWLEGKNLPPQTVAVLAFIYHQIELQPNTIALQHEQTELSYLALAEQSAAMALALCDMDISPGSIIALILPRGDKAISAALACMLVDCTFLFIDPTAPSARNQLILQDAQPKLIVVERITAELNATMLSETRITPLVTPQYLLRRNNNTAPQQYRALQKKMWRQAAQKPISQLSPHSAYLIYTSGSTGTPKGVAIGHRALAEFVASNEDSYCITANDRVLQFSPLHFDACIEEIFVSLSVGARIVIRNQNMLESMSAFLAQCESWNVSVLDLPTAFWHELAYSCTQLKLSLPPSLRLIIIGGEAVSTERVAQWRACYGDRICLFNTYGPSEATVIATCINLCSPNAILNNTAISIGKPLSGRALAIVDAQLNPVPKGEEGELLLLGAGLADRYLHLAEKTADAFINIHLPWFEKPERAYRTGDRVKINAENHIEFIGRLDDQLKISGYRIDPLEVETALAKLPDVREAAVIAVTAGDGNKLLVAHLAGNSVYSLQTLRSLLKAYLPDPMLPAQVMHHEKLPKNSSGKIDKKCLLQLSEHHLEKELLSNLNTSTITDFTQGQQLIAAIWQQVLGQKSPSLDDDFFALGGQSLQTIQVANRLATQLERDVPVAVLFQNPTIRTLNKILFSNDAQNAGSAEEKFMLVQEHMLADCLEFEINFPPATTCENTTKHHNVRQTILLTGATGFVGAQLLHQLTSTNHNIICAVRASSEGSAYQRLLQALVQQGLNYDNLPERVQIQLVDLEQPRLGLTKTEFEYLANNVTAIIHNAANTSVMRDYQSLRAANALSTGELLKLGAVKAIPFHLISTIAVAPPNIEAQVGSDNNNFLEENFVTFHSGLQDGYQQSKWVAEQMVAIAQQKGYPINVYRLARVTGTAESGYVNPKDLVWSILQAGLLLGVLPALEISEPWTPVDTVTQFIVKHSLANPGKGVFNLTPQKPVAFSQLYRWLTEVGADNEIIPLIDWCNHVKREGREEHQAIVEFFLQRSAHEPNKAGQTISLPIIHNRRFTELAEEYGMQIPGVNQTLFNRYFSYANCMGWFHSAEKYKVIIQQNVINTYEESLSHG